MLATQSLDVRVVERGWLRRLVLIDAPSGRFTLEYDGRGMGHESIYVNGELAARDVGTIWFVPRFEFSMGPHRVEVKIRCWPWFKIRRLTVTVDGRVAFDGC